MEVSNFQINSRVRGVFSRHWLDTSQLSVVTIKGIVYIGGKLRKLPAASNKIEINEDLMETIDTDIGRIKGVKRVTYRLEDWRKEAGKFISLTQRKKEAQEKSMKSEDLAKRSGIGREGRDEKS